MKLLILLAVVALLAVFAGFLFRSRTGPSGSSRVVTKPQQNPYPDLRNQAFTCKRTDIGIPAPGQAKEPWGAIMEMGYEKGPVTIVTFSDGSASIYLSSGGGFIGGIGHESVRRAAQAFVSAAGKFQPQMTAAKDFPEPTLGQAVFYIRTDEGLFSSSAPEKALGEGKHPLSPLFYAGQEVITQYRLLDQSPGK